MDSPLEQYCTPASNGGTAKAFIVSLAETGRRWQPLSSMPVSWSSRSAGLLPACLHPTILQYRDTLAYDIVIQFFLTIRALEKCYDVVWSNINTQQPRLCEC